MNLKEEIEYIILENLGTYDDCDVSQATDRIFTLFEEEIGKEHLNTMNVYYDEKGYIHPISYVIASYKEQLIEKFDNLLKIQSDSVIDHSKNITNKYMEGLYNGISIGKGVVENKEAIMWGEKKDQVIKTIKDTR